MHTRKLQLLLSLALLPWLGAAQNDGDRLFDPSFVHEIRFESPDANFYTQLIEAWTSAGIAEIPYLPANVRIDGQLIDSVGVRLKGGISIFAQKKPLKIDFNQYIAGQDFDGIKKLNLQNADQDAAVMRDVLGYHIFRQAGVKAPRTAYARVFINGADQGVYILVEQVDKTFLANHFASDSGTLYKNKTCDPQVDSGDSTFVHFNELNQIVNNLSGQAFVNALEQSLNTEACLRYFLIENFTDVRDNPIDVGCNYYLYHEPETGKLIWIPWDLNYAFYGGLNFPLIYDASQNELYLKLLATPVYRQRYLELACEMLDYLFVDADLMAFIDRNAQLIRAQVQTDPRYPFTFDRFDLEINALKAFMATRRQDMIAGLAAEGFSCGAFDCPVAPLGISINEVVASSDSTGGVADPAGDYPDWIELYNNSSETVSLEGFYLSHDADFRKHWAFPQGASMAPGSYLMVWADRDVTETGLHADFKLGKSGGQIFLTHEDFTVVDSLTYGPQSTNLAWARVPNGTGGFKQQAATFAASNGISAAKQPDATAEFELFPNPAAHTIQVVLPEHAGAEPFQVVLTDVLGRVVLRLENQAARCELSVERLPEGAYFVSVTQGRRLGVEKVVIRRD